MRAVIKAAGCRTDASRSACCRTPRGTYLCSQLAPALHLRTDQIPCCDVVHAKSLGHTDRVGPLAHALNVGKGERGKVSHG